MDASPKKIYQSEEKLLISIDIGTTASPYIIDRAAQHMLQAKLKGGLFGDDAYIQNILGEFERKTKRKFDGTQVSSIIKFGMVS